MRGIVSVLAAAVLVCGCGGTSSNGGDGGGGGTGSGSGSGSGSCSALTSGSYSIHYTYVSGGTMCQQQTPPDRTTPYDGGALNTGADAGSSCQQNWNGCTFSFSCNSSFGEAGSFQLSEMFTIASDGSFTGTYSSTINLSFGGNTMMSMCSYSITGTKQ